VRRRPWLSEDVGSTPEGSSGDEAAFAALVREHARAVFGVVFRRVGDRVMAEDLSQETFLRAWRARDSYRGDPSEIRGWLCTIASNVARDHVRAVRRRPREEEGTFIDIPATDDDPASYAEAADSLLRLRSALAELPSNQREMFLLRERDGLSYKEIAVVLGCPIGTVMSGLARAREQLIRAVSG
jgi:RNA polymerase sigma-70 factor (ECF subfamily)